ncbi:hypothetical protein GCM10007389_12360 [Pontibacter akesuensis]|nr:hypothetical protein GCM10007389_12360 [Pontibacter akesuensis]
MEATASDQALTEYRDIVTELEEDELSEVEKEALRQSANDTSLWTNEKANLQLEQEERWTAVKVNREELTEEQRAEIDDLNRRYETARQRRGEKYEEERQMYLLRRELLGLDTFNVDLEDVTSENIVEVYEHFVSTLPDKMGAYEQRDWNQVEGLWSSLNTRLDAVRTELGQPALSAISKAQARYLEIRKQANIR